MFDNKLSSFLRHRYIRGPNRVAFWATGCGEEDLSEGAPMPNGPHHHVFTTQNLGLALNARADLPYKLHPVTMGKIFSSQDDNPEETGYIAIFREEGKVDGIAICTWDRDTAMKIMDDLTFSTAEMTRLWTYYF